MLTLISFVLGLVSLGHVINAADPTGTYYASSFGGCDISLKAYGYSDTDATRGSYIKVNGLTYLDSAGNNVAFRGFNMVTLDTSTCRASNFGHWDTCGYPAESEKLASYIYNLPDGTRILGVTSDDFISNIQDSARNALKSIGVEFPGMDIRSKLLFDVVKGKPDKAVVQIAKPFGNSIFYEVKAPICNICQNGGVLKMNDEGTGLFCQCPKKYLGFYCDRINELCLK